MKRLTIAILFSLFVIQIPLHAQNGWKDLFNGRNLRGWEQLNGTAKYYVENGDLVGETVLGSPNSFLCTMDHYGDFILEFEVILEAPINSGVQIRSHTISAFMNFGGKVHGYQVEIDPKERAWSGGIYDESRRGWLYNLERNPKGREAFKMGEWNHFRVEAIGHSIRTWVNGVQCADLVDDMTPSGFIALQVHSIGKKEEEGKKIRWRNIRIMTEDLESHRTETIPEVPEISYLVNRLTENEKEKGWKLLWDGKTMNGWKNALTDQPPQEGWTISNGILTVHPAEMADIVTEDSYRNFILEVDFSVNRGANSGIKYFINPGFYGGKGHTIGCEFQILDDKNHPDGYQGIEGNRSLGALYDLIPAIPDERIDNKKRFNGIGSWNRARIVVKDCHVEHWLNNEKVVEYNRCTDDWRALVAKSKFATWSGFGGVKEGRILLQAHDSNVSFRNLKILELD
jgi:hypothetical protein